MWGKLGADILEGAWDAALEELNNLREHIDSRGGNGPGGPLLALQQRTWWLHWSLFVYFNHDNGRELLLESWLNQNYLNTIQTAAPHLLRYLVAAVVISRKSTLRSAGPASSGNSARSREAVRDVVRALGQEQYQYSDAVTEFLRKLYGEVDFAGAREEMALCDGESVLDDDFFLEPFKAEFVENARYLVSEAYCKIHRRIDIAELSDRLGLTREEGERWIVDLVRDARLDAKIDLKQNIVQMNHSEQPVYQTVIEKSRGLLFRSQAMASAIEVRACTSSFLSSLLPMSFTDSVLRLSQPVETPTAIRLVSPATAAERSSVVDSERAATPSGAVRPAVGRSRNRRVRRRRRVRPKEA
jgi:translation initiation factor 3 subunit E